MEEDLAINQVDVYWKHDAGDFVGLSKSVNDVYRLLGYQEAVSREAADYISQAYQMADLAEVAMRNSDDKAEREAYKRATDLLLRAEGVLGYSVSTARHQTGWWRHFRHKNMIRAFIRLYLQQAKVIGMLHLCRAFRATHILAKIGIAHNSRDKAAAIQEARRYWRQSLKENTKGSPYLG